MSARTAPATPPRTEPGPVRRVAPLLGAAGAVGVVSLGLHLRDPHVQGSWGICPTALLGFDCPFCGSLRAVHHLTNVDLVAAASSNLLLVVAAPVVAIWWVRLLVGRWQGRPLSPVPPLSRWVWLSLLVLLIVFTVVRNLPAGAWLHS
ncbi:DUF2752 domain-containing protein [Nocardioides limicola]|uniref:DUF2752 domain-containing protein n=1 Tax=Nocardioides limicola TaxID=2803368 RepID=UPI00193AE66F|nr:DUF2752 domain-containing protein [Nocardioides sp. DJM-14]